MPGTNERAVALGLQKTGRIVTAAGAHHVRRVLGLHDRPRARAAAVRLRAVGGDPRSTSRSSGCSSSRARWRSSGAGTGGCPTGSRGCFASSRRRSRVRPRGRRDERALTCAAWSWRSSRATSRRSTSTRSRTRRTTISGWARGRRRDQAGRRRGDRARGGGEGADRRRRRGGDRRREAEGAARDPRRGDGPGPEDGRRADRAATRALSRGGGGLGARSLALPAFGTGVGGFPVSSAPGSWSPRCGPYEPEVPRAGRLRASSARRPRRPSTAPPANRLRRVKGVVLAGGTGTRLHPLTRITNKHLLPVDDRPMVDFAIEALVQAGVNDLMLVTGGTHAGEFLRLLGNGHEWGIDRLLYAYQEHSGGIAEALGLAERFAGDEPDVVSSPTTSSSTRSARRSGASRSRRAARGSCSRARTTRSICATSACPSWRRRPRRPHRREAGRPAERLRRDGDLLLRGGRLRGGRAARALRPRRARDHRREQLVRGAGDDGVRRPRGLLGRRGRVDRRLLRRERPRSQARGRTSRDAARARAASATVSRTSAAGSWRCSARAAAAEAGRADEHLVLAARRHSRPALPRARPGRPLHLPHRHGARRRPRHARPTRSSRRTSATRTRSRSTSPATAHGFEALTDVLFCYHVTARVRPGRPRRARRSLGRSPRQGTCGAPSTPTLSPRDATHPDHGRRRPARLARWRAFAATRDARTHAEFDITAPPPLGYTPGRCAPRRGLDRRRRRRGRPGRRRGRERARDAQRGRRSALRVALLLHRLRLRRDEGRAVRRVRPDRAARRVRALEARAASRRSRDGWIARVSWLFGETGRTSSGRCSAMGARARRGRASSTTSAAPRPTSDTSRRRSRAPRPARTALPRRRCRGLHVGRVRGGDLRGRRAGLPRRAVTTAEPAARRRGRRTRRSSANARTLPGFRTGARGCASVSRGSVR